MKRVFYADTVAVKDKKIAVPPIKVCMHVVKPFRTDFRVMRSATALVEAGFEVSVIDVEAKRERPVEEDIRGVHVRHIFMPSWSIRTRFKPWFLVKVAQLVMRSAVRLLQIQTDIYHVHDENALLECCIAALIRRKPLIFDAHELPLNEPSVTRWHRLSSIARWVLGAILPRCAGIIATSPPTAQELQKLYHVSEVTLLRNVPAYRVVPRSDRLRQHLGLNTTTRIALYQGHLLPDRGLDILIRSANFLEPNIIIVMMGMAWATMRDELEALIASQGVEDRVKILPPVPYEELLDWTASADIGLITFPLDFSPAVRMMLPNKFFEYVMAGLPALATPIRAVEEIINTYDVGQVVSSLEPVDISAAMNTMLSNPDALDRMRRNALEVAQHEFNWEKERQKLIDLYYNILGVGH